MTVAFDEYVRLRGPRLVRLARLLIRDAHLAEDLVQDVLAKAFVRWRKIASAGDPDLYLRRMLINAHISWYRKRSNREIVVDTAADQADLTYAGCTVTERADQADFGHTAAERDAMWRLVLDLPAGQRAALVLRYYEDLDDQTIAEILGCSPVTVRSQVLRGLANLRQLMSGAEASPGGAEIAARSER